MVETLKDIIGLICLIGIMVIIGYELYRTGRCLYLWRRTDKLSYYRNHLDDKESFIKACEMIYGKLEQTLPHSIVLLELIKCEEDMTKWIYDMSKYKDKRVISVQITHPFTDKAMEHPLQIMSNQTVYIFKNGAVAWRDT